MESTQQQRIKFKTVQDWNDYIAPLLQSGKGITGKDLFELRKACYAEIEALRERPLLIYATKFLDGGPPGMPNQIDLSDVDGFTDLINSVGNNFKSVDVLLHSPGGRPDATERIVEILRNRFKEVNFLVPHSAYSAATMLVLSGNGIVLHPSATLGPIDPQVGVPTKEGMIRFVPAKSILNGFAKAKKCIKDEGPETLPAYIPLIEKYSLDLFELCEDSEKLSKELVSSWLKKYMFAGVKNNGRKIKKIVSYFSDYNTHKIHSRPLTPEKLSSFGLKLEVAENPLRDLLWEAYILLNGFFNVSQFVKLYECTNGVSWGKQFQSIMGPPQMQPQPRPQSQSKPQQ
ncbi:MAG: hypothetical protein M1501_01015 [Candidatus Omnitrophica bacterium]|nr:hypothetical protein [Candidatus Omnitrophota bacterium]